MNRIDIPRAALFEAAKILLRKVVPLGVAVGLWLAWGATAAAAVPAFPGAQGGGAESVGGRGGVVLEVTNLNDSGPGSLRAAVNAGGPRTVVFRVGGSIPLKSALRVRNPFITIAGQTAPGGGIELKGPGEVLQMMIIDGHDTIVRYIRIRKGFSGYPCNDPKTEGCGNNLIVSRGANDVVIDHVSSSWNQDEGLSANGSRNVTFSYNIQAEALSSHSTAFWVGSRDPATVTNVDFHHNLSMTHSHRVPLAKGGSGRFVNNLIYNGRSYFIRVGGGMKLDVIANKFKRGSMTRARPFHEVSGYENVTGAYNYGPPGVPSIYLSGNIGDHQADPAGDQWVMAHASPPRDENGLETGPMPSGWRRADPLADTTYPIIAEPVENLEAGILPIVGASRRLDCDGNWVANRDSVDARLINEYQTNTGRTSSPVTEADVGGYPTILNGVPCADADHDGMPDAWETAHGLNPNDAADRNFIAANEYTNLENYLNGPTTPSDAQSAAGRPNIIFLLADDLGYGDIGAFGQKKIRTPHLDQLAQDGLRLTQHYSGHNVCAPSRCVLLAGKHPGHAYIRGNRGGVGPHGEGDEGQEPVPAGELKLPLILKQLGYTTGGFGKWGLGGVGSTGDPNSQGLDRFFGYNDQAVAHNYYPVSLWNNRERVPLRNDRFSAKQKLPAGADPRDPASYAKFTGRDYAPDLINEAAREFLRENRDRPFFLYYPTTVPHLALQVPEDSLAEYKDAFPEEPYTGSNGCLPHRTPRAAYAAMVTRLDREIGKLLALVDEFGLRENTIVVFSSDNGPLWDRDCGSDVAFFNSHGGLRGSKGSYYEAGFRVPCIVRWTGRIKPGTTSERVTGFEDWLPTLLELAGAKESTPSGIDGISFAPTLLGRTQPQRPFLYRESPAYDGPLRPGPHGQQCVRVGNWKAIRTNLNPPPSSPNQAPGAIELYDLASDPSESRDVAAQHPEVVARLAAILREQHVPAKLWPIRALDEEAARR